MHSFWSYFNTNESCAYFMYTYEKIDFQLLMSYVTNNLLELLFGISACDFCDAWLQNHTRLDFIWTGHFERPPYNESTIRSVYHVREYDVHKLMQIEEPMDIFLSHDWPLGITDCGNSRDLIRQKPYFEKEVIRRICRWLGWWKLIQISLLVKCFSCLKLQISWFILAPST